MPVVKTDLERKLFGALRRIAKDYQAADRIIRNAERDYGLGALEGLEYAYDNIQQEAKNALKGVRLPPTPQQDQTK